MQMTAQLLNLKKKTGSRSQYKKSSGFIARGTFWHCISRRRQGTSAGSMLHMKVLLPGSQSATDVAFFLIDVKDLTSFPRKAGIDFA